MQYYVFVVDVGQFVFFGAVTYVVAVCVILCVMCHVIYILLNIRPFCLTFIFMYLLKNQRLICVSVC